MCRPSWQRIHRWEVLLLGRFLFRVGIVGEGDGGGIYHSTAESSTAGSFREIACGWGPGAGWLLEVPTLIEGEGERVLFRGGVVVAVVGGGHCEDG